jgi:hypothetical protein
MNHVTKIVSENNSVEVTPAEVIPILTGHNLLNLLKCDTSYLSSPLLVGPLTILSLTKVSSEILHKLSPMGMVKRFLILMLSGISKGQKKSGIGKRLGLEHNSESSLITPSYAAKLTLATRDIDYVCKSPVVVKPPRIVFGNSRSYKMDLSVTLVAYNGDHVGT